MKQDNFNDMLAEIYLNSDNPLDWTPQEAWLHINTASAAMVWKAMCNYLHPFGLILIHRDGVFEVVEMDRKPNVSHRFEDGIEAIDFALKLRASKAIPNTTD